MKAESAEKFIQQTRSLYNAVAEDFSRTRARLWPALNLFKDYIKDGDKVLDIGCGNGRLTRLFEEKEIEYLGIDYSRPLVEIARENFPNREFRVGDLLDLDIGDEKFDAAILVAVLHHIPSVELRLRALQNVNSVLRQGGLLLMTNWNLWQPRFFKYHLKYFIKRTKGEMDLEPGDILRQWGDTGNYRYVHSFTKEELKNICQKTGFKIIKNFYVNYAGSKGNFLNAPNIMTICQKASKKG